MTDEKYIMKPKCDCLLDQNHYIGDDPIGHACFNDAVYQTKTHFFCDDCKQLFMEGSERITLRGGSVIGWKERVEYFQEMALERMREFNEGGSK
jgi:hypothetical protein